VYVYCVDDCKPVTVTGELDPVAVYEPGDEVTVYDLPAIVPALNATEALPLLYALLDGESVATTDVGVEADIPTCSQP
jgi:hypothetical protein